MRRYMERKWMFLLLGWIAWGTSSQLSAQTQTVVSDSVSIIHLMEQVERATSYKIYTDMPRPFMVKKQEGMASLEQLRKALEGTSWRVTVYGNRVFVMQNLNLQAHLPEAWTKGVTEGRQGIRMTEVLTSENKIYEIVSNIAVLYK